MSVIYELDPSRKSELEALVAADRARGRVTGRRRGPVHQSLLQAHRYPQCGNHRQFNSYLHHLNDRP